MTPIEDRKVQLERRLEELSNRRQRLRAEREEVTAPAVVGPAEEPVNEEVLVDLEESALHEIRVIRAALDRIRQGSYGTCVRCGDEISQERLDVLPATPVCRDCAGG